MTNTLQDPIDRLAHIVDRFVNASTARMERQEAGQELERAQIWVEEQLGELAGYVQRDMEGQEQHERMMEEYRRRQEQRDREWEEFRQQQAENAQRLDAMLQEIQFLIRQQYPVEDDPTQGEEA